MKANPVTARKDILAAELINLMKKKSISGVMITDDSGVVGALNMQDLLRAGVL
jgi:arabinose-5-phosphate isomerase